MSGGKEESNFQVYSMLENCSLLNKNAECVKNNHYKIEKTDRLVYNSFEQKCRLRQK